MHRAIALALSAALLALPSAALAQSAGDEQYVDPFQGDQQQEPQPQQAQPAPEPAAPAPAAPAGATESDEAAAQPAQTGVPTLPRTGLAALPLMAAGIGLVAAGAALRRRL